MPKPTVSEAFDSAFDTAATDTNAAAALESPATTAAPSSSEGTHEAAQPSSEAPVETAPAAAEGESTPDDGEPDALSISPEELAKIKADPALSKMYRGMNKSFTQKSMGLAQERQLLEALKNPQSREATFRALATTLGYNIAQQAAPETPKEVKQQVDVGLQKLTENLSKSFEPNTAKALAEALRPSVTDIVTEAVAAQLNSRVAPLEEATGSLAQQAWAAQAEAEVKTFWATRTHTPALEAKMTELANQFQPVGDNFNRQQYLEYLYRIASGDAKTTAVAKELGERVAKAASTQEPRAGSTAPRVASTAAARPNSFGHKDIDRIFDQRLDEAFAEASRGAR
jgi:hypothetical protein